jgi:hypothetical protein
MLPWAGPLALLFVYDLKARLNRVVADVACSERSRDRYESAVLLAVWDSTAAERLQLPLTSFAPC